jgi:hypothetical protein
MKHDFRQQATGDAADRFRAWLERETINSLRHAYGNAEATKTSIFLFANRAYEAHMPEGEVGRLFGKCLVRAGFREDEEEPAIAWLEFFGVLAARVHGGTATGGPPDQG